ncbi:MAG: Fur family transcriptional regulator [Steroidobacteraceae bacterium]
MDPSAPPTRATTDPAAGTCEQRLSECGIRPTAQRVRIAILLLAAPQHLSAEQILASLRAAGARVSKATVYNTLNLFAARGLIRQLSIDGSRAWFDSNVDAHYHFHDVDSGALIDVPVPEVEFSKLPVPPPGTEVAGIDLVIRLRRKL